MTFSSPEEQRDSALADLARAVSRLNPMECAATFLSMSGDEIADETYLSRQLLDGKQTVANLEDLANSFDRDFVMAKTYLAEFWGVPEQGIAFPVDESQSVARYFSRYKGEDYVVTVTKWLQPNPFNSDSEEMMGVCVDPQWSLTPVRHVIYLNRTPLFSCKYDGPDAPKHFETVWGETETLTPDDAHAVGMVTRRISVHAI